ncbi:MAG: hypothetical protein U9R25_00210 [Chloroflexota bacterium]|nr:hypothetical protein [Chloroflexota bacterium]
MKIDIFDLSPFEPIARYSLVMALAFVGGSIISVLFSNPLAGGVDLRALAVYAVLAVVAVLVFFLGMRDTHRVLAKTKKEELKTVDRKIIGLFRSLPAGEEGAQNRDFEAAATELNLWSAYEKRLKGARTWPYNTGMMRALLLSVCLPAATSIAQHFLVKWIGG